MKKNNFPRIKNKSLSKTFVSVREKKTSSVKLTQKAKKNDFGFRSIIVQNVVWCVRGRV